MRGGLGQGDCFYLSAFKNPMKGDFREGSAFGLYPNPYGFG
jgi:hypothetical protein